jgi:hypothetical protein
MNDSQTKSQLPYGLKLLLPVLLALAGLLLGNRLVAANAPMNSGAIWLEQAQLIASDGAEGDTFGSSVAMEGDIVVIGAQSVDSDVTNTGAAYIFIVDNATGTMTEIANLVASDATQGDLLGRSVAISGDVIVVGASNAYANAQGRAYVFQKPTQGWTGTITETAILRASNRGSNDEFGFSVGVYSDTIVVGARGEDEAGGQAGALYVFEKPVGGWSGVLEENAKLIPSVSPGNNGYLGQSVAIEGDVIASAVFLGSVGGDDDVGRGYVFVKPQIGWTGTLTETAELLASDGQAQDELGLSIAIENGVIALGAHQYEPPGSNTNYGAIYVFEEPAGGWTGTITEAAKLVASDPGSQEKLGTSVAMYGDTIVAGPIAWDRAYIFTKPVGGWTGTLTETQRIDEDVTGDNDFGARVVVYNDQIVVTARYDDQIAENAGRAYLFTPNQIPVADAGDNQEGNAGALMQLDGSASYDPDGNLPLAFQWQQTGGSSVTLSDASAISPTFTAPSATGMLTFTLIVTDSLSAASLPDEVVITILGNQIPVADAGDDQEVDAGALVQLDGSDSYDPDGNLPLTFQWQQTGGTSVSLSDMTSISPTFTAPTTTDMLTFTLVVTDSQGGASEPDMVQVMVQAEGPPMHKIFLPLTVK